MPEQQVQAVMGKRGCERFMQHKNALSRKQCGMISHGRAFLTRIVRQRIFQRGLERFQTRPLDSLQRKASV